MREHRTRSMPLALALALIGAFAVGGTPRTSDFDPATPADWHLPEPDLFSVEARDDLAWAVGYWGSILRSTDGGDTWSHVETPTDATLYDVAFGDASNGWAVGAEGTLLRSTDEGRTWQAVEVSVVDPFDGSERRLDSSLFGVAAVSSTEAWTVGDFGVVLHTRNGLDWEQVVLPEEAFPDDNIPDRIFNAVAFADQERGWIVGEFGTTLRTTDGGQTWIGERELRGAIEDIYLFDVAPNDDGLLIAGGVGGVVIASVDGGQVWQALNAGTSAGLFGTSVHGDRAILVGDRGVLLVTFDGGTTWIVPERPRSFNWMRGAAFAGNGRAYVVGEDGLILRSSDGGSSWEWKMGHEPPPQAGVSVPDPGPRAKPTRRVEEQKPE